MFYALAVASALCTVPGCTWDEAKRWEFAERLAQDITAQTEAWETVKRGNPALVRALEEQGFHFAPVPAQEYIRRWDAIHYGSGCRSNGFGAVNGYLARKC